MKLRTVAALGLVSVLGLAACGSSDGESGGGGLSNSGDSGSGSGSEATADFPAGPIELVVPFDPGGGTDFAGRTIAQSLEVELDESVTVVNVPGAGGQIGATELSTESTDGQTIGLMSAGILTTLPVIRDTAYDLESFEVIGKVAVSRQVLYVQADAPWQTVDDLVTYAKQNPGEFTYGTSGIGSTAHLAMGIFMQEAGIEAEHVVYDGLGASKTDLMSGNINGAIGPVTDSDESRVRPLFSFSDERGVTSQDIPLLSEVGYDSTMEVIHYLVAPKGTAESTIELLEGALQAAAENPDTAEAFSASELELSFSDGDASAQELQEYQDVTLDIVDKLGIQE